MSFHMLRDPGRYDRVSDQRQVSFAEETVGAPVAVFAGSRKGNIPKLLLFRLLLMPLSNPLLKLYYTL